MTTRYKGGKIDAIRISIPTITTRPIKNTNLRSGLAPQASAFPTAIQPLNNEPGWAQLNRPGLRNDCVDPGRRQQHQRQVEEQAWPLNAVKSGATFGAEPVPIDQKLQSFYHFCAVSKCCHFGQSFCHEIRQGKSGLRSNQMQLRRVGVGARGFKGCARIVCSPLTHFRAVANHPAHLKDAYGGKP